MFESRNDTTKFIAVEADRNINNCRSSGRRRRTFRKGNASSDSVSITYLVNDADELVVVSRLQDSSGKIDMHVRYGYVDRQNAMVLRDTGCTGVM